MRNLAGPTLVFLAAMAWSTAGLFTRVVTTDIPTTLFWRSLVGGLCVLLFYASLHRKRHVRDYFRFSIGEAVIATLSTCGMICFISSFFYTSIANVSFVYGTMPLITLVLSVAVLSERASLTAAFCCALCAAGVGVMVWGEQRFDDVLGILLAFGMTFFMAAMTIAAKYFPGADMAKTTYLSAFLGAAVVLPFSSFGETLLADYAWLGFYGIMNVGLGFGVYLVGVSRTSAIAAALIGLAEIPLAPIWAYLLFAEEVFARTVVGGCIILSATTIYLLASERGRRTAVAS